MSERVPRYTSYPPAPYFHTGIDARDYSAWLAQISEQQALSLYFHIPFCRQLCWFCGCHAKVINAYEPVQAYLKQVKREVSLVAQQLKAKPRVSHVHFGGGSPTIIQADDFSDFMRFVRKQFDFDAQAEIAVEIDPRTVDQKKIKAYAQSGVTRASLGVQDFTPAVQQAINREQPFAMVADVVEMLRAQAINALNIDLIYGLPYQNAQTMHSTIAQTLSLQPDRISLFGYAHVPWMKKHQQLVPQNALPAPDQRKALFEQASAQLIKAGYVAIGLDHFAKQQDALSLAQQQGRLQRNFQGYTTDSAEALLGFGVSSISSLPQGYLQNSASTSDYASALEQGQLPIVRGFALSEQDQARRKIIMDLMCNLQAGVDSEHYHSELKRLQPYINQGAAKYQDGVLSVAENAQSELRVIASVFDSYLSNSEHRFSQAV